MNVATQLTSTPRSTMTPEAQRIAIAEACGWRSVYREGTVDFGMCGPAESWDKYPGWIAGKPSPDARLSAIASPPDYLVDLNAMHDAEKVLTGMQQQKYYHRSTWERFGAGMHSIKHRNDKVAISATAAQRAEAFLRTLNLWKESAVPRADSVPEATESDGASGASSPKTSSSPAPASPQTKQIL